MVEPPKLSKEAKERIKKARQAATDLNLLTDPEEYLLGGRNEALQFYAQSVFRARVEEYWELIPHHQFEGFCKKWLVPDVADKAIKALRYSRWPSVTSQQEEKLRTELGSFLLARSMPTTLNLLYAMDPDLSLSQEHSPSLENENRLGEQREGLGQTESLAERSAPQGTDPKAEERHAAVDAYIQEVLQKTNKRITRKDFWMRAGYKSPTDFERWQRNDPRTTKAAEVNFDRVLREKPHLKNS